MRDISNYSLLRHNTFGIDVLCHRFLEFDTVEEACSVLPTIVSRPYVFLGGGSNMLFTEDYYGVVVRSNIRGVEMTDCGDTVLLRCGSAEVVDDVIAFAVDNGWHGAENLSLIPGEVGASAVQNVGAYGAEAKDIIMKVEAVEAATGRVVEFTNGECGYGYRQSRFKGEWKNRYFITHVTYALSRTFTPLLHYGNIIGALERKGIASPTAQQVRDAVIEIRRSKLPDPAEVGNAGSFFMNPIVDRCRFEQLLALYPQMPHYDVDADHVKIPAGWMIEQCGWKGRSLGKAGVYHKQALVLVNLGGASGRDILRLCHRVRENVRAKFGVDISPEVNII